MALLKNKEKIGKKTISPIDIINVLEKGNIPWNELDEDFKEIYEKYIFLINRFISSKELFLPLLDLLTTKKFNPGRHYELLRIALAGRSYYFNLKAYKKNDEDDKYESLLSAIQKEYDLTKKEAKEHLMMVSKEEANKILDKWKVILSFKKS